MRKYEAPIFSFAFNTGFVERGLFRVSTRQLEVNNETVLPPDFFVDITCVEAPSNSDGAELEKDALMSLEEVQAVQLSKGDTAPDVVLISQGQGPASPPRAPNAPESHPLRPPGSPSRPPAA